MDLTKKHLKRKGKNMLTIGTYVVVAAVAFVVGVLFGRRNTKKVETALADAKALLKKAGIDA